MPFIAITPDKWPQDSLHVPPGLGGMPPIEGGNRSVVGAEFFALSARFQFAAATPAQTIQQQIILTPQDGDFWCDQIGAVSWAAQVGAAADVPGFLQTMVGISDVRTGKSLVRNAGLGSGFGANLIPPDTLPINALRTLPELGTGIGRTYDGTTPPPAGFRTQGSLIQPFCFTRQGGITVTLTTLKAAPGDTAFDVTIGFMGWKEYANASS